MNSSVQKGECKSDRIGGQNEGPERRPVQIPRPLERPKVLLIDIEAASRMRRCLCDFEPVQNTHTEDSLIAVIA